MSDFVQLLAVSPEGVLFQGEVLWAQIPLADGLLGVWPEHAPLIASLAAGRVEYGVATGVESLEVDGGTVRIHNSLCVLLVGAPIELDGSEDHAELFDAAADVLEQELPEDQRQEIGL